MNKYIYIIIAAVVLLGAGIGYKQFSGKNDQVANGETREITIIAKQNKWNWVPDDITVNQGDTIVITVINEDEYDHGFAIDAYGISQRVSAKSTVKIDPFVVSRPGEFPFYCSVPCGDGEVAGKKRGHFDQVGKIHVKEMVKME